MIKEMRGWLRSRGKGVTGIRLTPKDLVDFAASAMIFPRVLAKTLLLQSRSRFGWKAIDANRVLGTIQMGQGKREHAAASPYCAKTLQRSPPHRR